VAFIAGTSSEESRYRFTVLTSRLIRMEHSPTGVFTDAATQLVVNRDLGETPSFRVVHGQDRVEIITEHLHLTHVPSLGFSPAGLSVRLRSTALHAHGGTWHHGDVWDPAETFPTNLGGTTRTLDEADGAVALGPGLLSLNGITALDDSASLLLTQDERVQPRPPRQAARSPLIAASTSGSLISRTPRRRLAVRCAAANRSSRSMSEEVT